MLYKKDANKELVKSLLAADAAWLRAHPEGKAVLQALWDSARSIRVKPTEVHQPQRILGNVFVHMQVVDNPTVPRRHKTGASYAYLVGLFQGLELGLHHRPLLQEFGIDV